MQLLIKTFSIHASAKEATLRTPHYRVLHYIFNPRLREGGDMLLLFLARVSIFFQSTPPRRRRLSHNQNKRMCHHFQSTPPRRRRPWSQSLIHTQQLFNPRLREGGDSARHTYEPPIYFSIHASAKEATATYCNTPAIMCISSLNNFFVHHFQLYIAIYCTISPFSSANALRFLRSL